MWLQALWERWKLFWCGPEPDPLPPGDNYTVFLNGKLYETRNARRIYNWVDANRDLERYCRMILYQDNDGEYLGMYHFYSCGDEVWRLYLLTPEKAIDFVKNSAKDDPARQAALVELVFGERARIAGEQDAAKICA